MKVLYFHQHFNTPRGSGGTRSFEMSRALIAAGHEVHVVCGSYQGADTGLNGTFVNGRRSGVVDGIRVTELALNYANSQSLSARSLVFLAFAARSVKIALTDSYDLLFATSTPLTAGIPGIAARLLRRKPFVFEVRDLWPELPRAMGVIRNPLILGMLEVLERASYRCANRCIGLSPGMVAGIRRKSRPGMQVAMISNGCDLALFRQATEMRSSTLKLEASDFVAIFSGSHGQANGLDAALDAAAVLKRRQCEHVKLVFLGAGGQRDNLIERARREGLDNCRFLASVPKLQLGDYVKSADVGLMLLADVPAFYYGTSPNKFFDYLALGMPVLTNYPGWVAGIIESRELGLAVPPNRPEAFADALLTLAADRQALQSMGERSGQVAREQFDRARLGQEFVRFLEGTLEGKHQLVQSHKT